MICFLQKTSYSPSLKFNGPSLMSIINYEGHSIINASEVGVGRVSDSIEMLWDHFKAWTFFFQMIYFLDF